MRLPRSPAKNRAFGRASPSAARKARLNDPEVLRLVDYSEIERWLDTVMPGTRNAVEDLGVREPAPPLRLSGGSRRAAMAERSPKGLNGEASGVSFLSSRVWSPYAMKGVGRPDGRPDGLRRSSRPCSASR